MACLLEFHLCIQKQSQTEMGWKMGKGCSTPWHQQCGLSPFLLNLKWKGNRNIKYIMVTPTQYEKTALPKNKSLSL